MPARPLCGGRGLWHPGGQKAFTFPEMRMLVEGGLAGTASLFMDHKGILRARSGRGQWPPWQCSVSCCQSGSNQRPSKFVFSLEFLEWDSLFFSIIFLETHWVSQKGVWTLCFRFSLSLCCFIPHKTVYTKIRGHSLHLSLNSISRLKPTKTSMFRSTDKMLSGRKGLGWLLGGRCPEQQGASLRAQGY